MKDVKSYRITCLKCKGSSRIKIADNNQVVYVDHTPIIACRFRGDMQWGFECICRNDSRLAKEEKDQADILVQGGDHALKHLIDSLKINDERKFRMEIA